jgi:hypothetical protein
MEKAFFPGGNGLFLGAEAVLLTGGTLILGSNFGCVADYLCEDGSLMRKDETRSSATWKGLYRMLPPETGIRLESCFFTNAWPFLHQGTTNETKGLIPIWLSDTSLMAKCLRFFQETLKIVRPRLVVGLGTGASAFLSCLWPDELREWRGNSVISLDKKPIGEVEALGYRLVCTAITHPSHTNSWRRTAPFQGTRGEIALLTSAALRFRSATRSP